MKIILKNKKNVDLEKLYKILNKELKNKKTNYWKNILQKFSNILKEIYMSDKTQNQEQIFHNKTKELEDNKILFKDFEYLAAFNDYHHFSNEFIIEKIKELKTRDNEYIISITKAISFN